MINFRLRILNKILYQAVVPTAARSATLVGILLPTYDFSKRVLITNQILLDDMSCHFAYVFSFDYLPIFLRRDSVNLSLLIHANQIFVYRSSLIAATFGTCASCPIEVIRVIYVWLTVFSVTTVLDSINESNWITGSWQFDFQYRQI